MRRIVRHGPFRIVLGAGERDWCSACGGSHGGRGIQIEFRRGGAWQAARICAPCSRDLRRLLSKRPTAGARVTSAHSLGPMGAP